MSDTLLLSPRSTSTLKGDSVNGTNHATQTKGKLPMLSDAAIKDVAKLFKLLADETRLRILTLLTQNDECPVSYTHLGSCGGNGVGDLPPCRP